MEIAKLSDAEFKTLVIGMLRELIEYDHKIKEEMKEILSEIKKDIQGTKVKGNGLGFKSVIWKKRKK